MKKPIVTPVIALTLTLAMTACGAAPSPSPSSEDEISREVIETPDTGAADGAQAPLEVETPSAEPEMVRQDGERYEGVIMLEGMEQAVQYEHMVNKTVGFEMDYDYETFTRYGEADRERFILSWGDPENPEYYLEVAYSQEDAETAAASIREALSEEYEVIEFPVTLDRAGSCVQIGGFEVKGGGHTADHMQVAYVIPANDGCRIATAHYGFDSSDLFGARFSAMVNTLSVIER